MGILEDKRMENLKPLAYNPVYPPHRDMWGKTEEQMPSLERVLKCVVFIGAVSNPGGFNPTFVPYGTGFVISLIYEDFYFDYIITCKHVIDLINSDKVCVRLNLKEGGSKSVSVDKESWVFDIKNDIAALSQKIGELFDWRPVFEQDIITKYVVDNWYQNHGLLLVGEESFLVGLFTNHYGREHNIPIIRRGNIAAIPDDVVFTETGYVKAYLVETRSIGGLSGSPVFLSKFDPGFLGMMRGRLNTQDINDVVGGDSIPDAINTGIGVVIPGQTILDFINQSAFKTQREETVKELKKKTHFRPSAAIPAADNPQHKEDFNSLLTAAVKKKPPTDET
jgi:hypothetical protein